jgi:hypothetical protein
LLAIAIDVLWYYATYQLEPFWCVACGRLSSRSTDSWIRISIAILTQAIGNIAIAITIAMYNVMYKIKIKVDNHNNSWSLLSNTKTGAPNSHFKSSFAYLWIMSTYSPHPLLRQPLESSVNNLHTSPLDLVLTWNLDLNQTVV